MPLGVITGKIADWQITSSSVYPVEWDKDCAERYARVYQPDRLGWCPKYKSASEWLQVDLGVASKVRPCFGVLCTQQVTGMTLVQLRGCDILCPHFC